MNRALLVGINKYPGAPLNGCINDITDMAHFLSTNCELKTSDIRLVTDERATTANIFDRLGWLITSVRAGDHLVFHYSGHGAQVPTRNFSGEVDKLDEVICPVDFDWSDKRLIRDKDFARLFGSIPSGVKLTWISDSCHSADLSRDFLPHGRLNKLFPVPADMNWRQVTARDKKMKAMEITGSGKQLANGVLISGCKSNQTYADATFKNRSNGALTYYLLKTLTSKGGLKLPMSDVLTKVRASLKSNDFSQVPQLEGSSTLMKKPFVG